MTPTKPRQPSENEVLRRMLATPPQPHVPKKPAQRKAKKPAKK